MPSYDLLKDVTTVVSNLTLEDVTLIYFNLTLAYITARMSYLLRKNKRLDEERKEEIKEVKRINGEIRSLYDTGQYDEALKRVGEIEEIGDHEAYHKLARVIRERIAEKIGEGCYNPSGV